ncbi:MAG: DUF3566 domain-containing protein [Candidatus Zixiibacteriota bacterium]
MRYELKTMAVWPFVKVSFFLNLIIGFIVGLLYAMFFGFIVSVMRQIPGVPGAEFDVAQLPIGILMIVLPIMFSLMGAFFNTVLGALVVLIYNAIARFAGGIEFELAEVKPEWTPHSTPPPPPGQCPPQPTSGPATAPPPPPPAVEPKQPPPGSKYE